MAVRTPGVCVQKDDFHEILQALHEADGVIVEAPIYYNCAAAQALTVVNRPCCSFACKTYQLGPKKRVGVMLTCTGSEVGEMKRHIHNITSLPSVSRAISEGRTEVFTGCVSDATCRDSEVYLRREKFVLAAESLAELSAPLLRQMNGPFDLEKSFQSFSRFLIAPARNLHIISKQLHGLLSKTTRQQLRKLSSTMELFTRENDGLAFYAMEDRRGGTMLCAVAADMTAQPPHQCRRFCR